MTHLPDETVAAYLDLTLADTERAEVDRHLADCATCREEMNETLRLVKATHGRSRRWSHWVWIGAAAAIVTTILVLPIGEPGELPTTDILREGGGAGVELARIVPLPPNTSLVGGQPVVTLGWESRPGDLTYRVTLSDGVGATLWTGETTEASVTLDPMPEIQTGALLFWYVDASLPNGESATTGVQQLIIP